MKKFEPIERRKLDPLLTPMDHDNRGRYGRGTLLQYMYGATHGMAAIEKAMRVSEKMLRRFARWPNYL